MDKHQIEKSQLIHVETPSRRVWGADPLCINDIILSSNVYDVDLGMRRIDDIKRQLRVDVPRCNVSIDGVHTIDHNIVYRRAPYPRMSTQAVMAPVVEWFIQNDIVAREATHNRTMSVRIDTRFHTMDIKKHLQLFCWDGTYLCDVDVNIHANKTSNTVIVSSRPYTTQSKKKKGRSLLTHTK